MGSQSRHQFNLDYPRINNVTKAIPKIIQFPTPNSQFSVINGCNAISGTHFLVPRNAEQTQPENNW